MNRQFIRINDNTWINVNNIEKIILTETGRYMICTRYVPYYVDDKYKELVENFT